MAPPSPAAHGSVTPLSAERYCLRVTIGPKARKALLSAQAILRRKYPPGDLDTVIENAIVAYAEELEARSFAKLRRAKKPSAAQQPATHDALRSAPEHAGTPNPSPTEPLPVVAASEPTPNRAARRKRSRYIPRPLRRAVFERDGYRCTHLSPQGHRCSETSRLELHHLVPFAKGGEHTLAGLTVRCQAHNLHDAVLDFGEEMIRARIAAGRAQHG